MSHIGVAHALFNSGTMKLFKELSGGWDFDPETVSLQNTNMAFHSVIMHKIAGTPKDHPSRLNIVDIMNDSIPVEKALEVGFNDDVWKWSSTVCGLSLQYLDINGEFQLCQLGAVLYQHNAKEKEKQTYFAAVLPKVAANDPSVMTELGFSRNERSGKIEFHNVSSMTTCEATSEIQALMDLFTFLKTHNSRNSIMVTYSSYTTLPVVLQLVERHGLETIFYSMFSAYCDIHSLVTELHRNSDHYTHGVPPFQELASELAADTRFISHPSAGDSAAELVNLIYRIIDDSDIEGRKVTQTIKKCSRDIGQLHYEDGYCQEMFPASEQFIWPNETKNVEFRMEFSDDEMDFSKLMFVLHNEVCI